ncbi:TetR/AcrR family transcriptional regulator [Sandaracinus amylolyticus]|uniref:Transcriptional regulator, TetR family protein n=1 Tax=Sandaracinus amylolyticus TaxID=927083 RepID=A0A0F6YGW3_9BACT|nr:TetR/AcrR family transcriptional regulator [Sandaracinus amylolyticus]AKF05141.1 Transcriptional regulator, TetR family protein [Sandaracinus amylolyticus]
MGRPPKFSRARLQEAALALVDEHGLEGLSMRALASALGTGPMTLYNHVANREDLEVLVVEAVLAQAQWSRGCSDDWREDARELALTVWRALRAHPRVVPLVLTRRSRSPIVADFGEAMLAALARSGRSGHALLVAFRAITALIMGFAQGELAGPLATSAGEPADEVIERFRSLPRDRYPGLVDIAEAARESDPEREFREGLELLLDGLSRAR